MNKKDSLIFSLVIMLFLQDILLLLAILVNGNIKSNKNGKVKSAQFLLLFFNLVYLFYGKNCHKGGTK